MEETSNTEQEIAKIEAELINLANRRNQLLNDCLQYIGIKYVDLQHRPKI
jgi:hypothetical protein